MKTSVAKVTFRARSNRLKSLPEIHNGMLAELLAQEAERSSGHLQRAFRRAARAAFLWPVEAAELLQSNRPLTELPGVGPHLEKRLRQWIENNVQPQPTPAVRRNFLTLTQARTALALNPEWAEKLRGDLQMHSTWSDGAGSIQEMARAALARGYEYIAITDHSKGLKIAGGIDERQLLAQAEEIEAAQREVQTGGRPFRVLHALELNLNPAGGGDMDSTALRKLDLVVGSFHSALRITLDQTDRYLAALRNPDIHILGHPRGRIYNHRLGLSANWERIFDEALELDKAVEVDSYPDRQDLDVELLHRARDAGIRIAIDTDAHAPEQLAFIELGLASACLAGIPPSRVVNFMPADDLLSWIAAIRSL